MFAAHRNNQGPKFSDRIGVFTRVQFLDSTELLQDGKFAADDMSCTVAASPRTNRNGSLLSCLHAHMQHA